jgi:hypothetical protein
MKFLASKYLPVGGLVLFFVVVYFVLIPESIRCCDPGRYRAIIAALLFGSLVGASEIASRYRDEPLKAVRSPFGLAYVAINGGLSVLALFFIFHFKSFFGSVSQDYLTAALAAGFGAAAVMRTRVAVIKGGDGKDVSIGPDYVINVVMGVINTGIDRWRAVRRQEILRANFPKLVQLGDFASAWLYLMTSLLAFQNLDASTQKTLNDTYNDYQAQKYGDDIKRLGLGFLFLTLVGESNFEALLDSAVAIKTKTNGGAPSGGSSTSSIPKSSSPIGSTGSSQSSLPATPSP